MKQITAANNQEIKKIVALHDKKGRSANGLFIAEGLKVIDTFIQANWHPRMMYVTVDKVKTAQSLSPHLTLVSDIVMKKISTNVTPSGIIGVFEHKKTLCKARARSLVLAHISDPGNMGTLIRTAAALACPNVLVIDGCDPFSPKVIQASAGAHALVDVISIDWNTLIKQKKGLHLCALVVHNGKSPDALDLKNSILIVGNESHGIPEEWINQCDQLLTLPMPGNTESLNASVAGSIALYEQFRSLVK